MINKENISWKIENLIGESKTENFRKLKCMCDSWNLNYVFLRNKVARMNKKMKDDNDFKLHNFVYKNKYRISQVENKIK